MDNGNEPNYTSSAWLFCVKQPNAVEALSKSKQAFPIEKLHHSDGFILTSTSSGSTKLIDGATGATSSITPSPDTPVPDSSGSSGSSGSYDEQGAPQLSTYNQWNKDAHDNMQANMDEPQYNTWNGNENCNLKCDPESANFSPLNRILGKALPSGDVIEIQLSFTPGNGCNISGDLKWEEDNEDQFPPLIPNNDKTTYQTIHSMIMLNEYGLNLLLEGRDEEENYMMIDDQPPTWVGIN